MLRGISLSLASTSLLLASCTSVPRGPALSLAKAGISTTGAFGSDVRDTAGKVQYIDVTDAFVATYDYCANPALPCEPQLQQHATFQLRQDLAKAIKLRAGAIDTLGKAYEALKTEAEYDARGDLVGATNDAIEGVNNFATAIAALGGPGGPLIGETLGKIVGFGAGLLADRNQKKRLVSGSKAISAATRRFREALAREAYVFESLAAYVEKNRTAARVALLDAGVASNADALLPITSNLGLKPAANVDTTVAKSVQTKTAIKAMLQAQSRSDVQTIRNKYKASLAALDALLGAHAELETGQSVSLADVERFLGELDAALEPKTEG